MTPDEQRQQDNGTWFAIGFAAALLYVWGLMWVLDTFSHNNASP